MKRAWLRTHLSAALHHFLLPSLISAHASFQVLAEASVLRTILVDDCTQRFPEQLRSFLRLMQSSAGGDSDDLMARLCIIKQNSLGSARELHAALRALDATVSTFLATRSS